MRRILILILVFCLLAIFQKSFGGHFIFFGATLNLVLVGVFLINTLEKESYQSPSLLRCGLSWVSFGVLAGVLGGTILDLFSSIPFGIFTLVLTLSAFFVKKISKIFQESNILASAILFLAYFVFYKALLIFEKMGLDLFFKKNFDSFVSFNPEPLFSEFLLSLFLVFLIFSFYKKYEFFLQKKK